MQSQPLATVLLIPGDRRAALHSPWPEVVATWAAFVATGAVDVVFFFVGEVASRALRPAPGLELAWHELGRVRELPLVDDLHELLHGLLTNPEPVLAVERYDGADRPLAFAFDGEQPAPRGGPA
jgi:acyl-coenzyme A synthetase/AMP-(fatty) acid ligase